MFGLIVMLLLATATAQGTGATGATGIICSNTCATANNGICEDGGSGSVGTPAQNLGMCQFGTDCNDCGDRSKFPMLRRLFLS